MPDNYFFDKYEIEDARALEFEALGYIVCTEAEFNQTMNAIDLTAYNAAIAPTPQEIVDKKISDAKTFGETILNEFSRDNVLVGITQAGKTEAVTRYLHFVQHYVETGSLYAAINEINIKLSEGIPENLAPFVTNDRMINFLNKIKIYLGIPI